MIDHMGCPQEEIYLTNLTPPQAEIANGITPTTSTHITAK